MQMSRINTNVPALQAIGRLSNIHLDLNTRLERLSTGLRINRGKDDPAGLIASETLRAEIHGIGQAIDNSTRAINVISTAEGALNEVSSLLLGVRDLLVATANEGALTSEEIAANQLEIDALLSSIDRIANNTTFGGLKLLDGHRSYTLSSNLDPSQVASVAIFSARVPENSARNVVIQVIQSAQTAQIAFVAQDQSDPMAPAHTSATTIEIAGTTGTETLSFASGATLDEIKTAINDITNVTGVSAVLSTVAAGPVNRVALLINSTRYGSDEFVSVKPISGDFIEAGNSGATIDDTGRDASVLINGQAAAVRGLRADMRSIGLDMRVFLSPEFGGGAVTERSSTFDITGGGSIFQLTPTVSPVGQVSIGIDSVSTPNLGNNVVGHLNTLVSGGSNEVSKGNFIAAQEILSEAINQVAVIRGRLGSLQKNQLQTNINSQQVALENVTASESAIRDADIAEEVAALTRAQILVQSTQATLLIATNAPSAVLSLLG
jgi:flagellin